ncbi:MAG: HEPN domain-containing protein [Prosthecobacter sp.]|uniref:HEPN domain-containing protein n=1 Tax=Prosthecobacter sp. TaxID=1965333 RepID=UPI003901C2A1
MKPLSLEWIGKAEGDYAVAMTVMRSRKSRIHDAVCFHCQQCVEKMLKARLCEDGVSFPKTHDIEVVLNLLLPAYPLWAALLPLAKNLSAYAVDFRYPGDAATPVEAKQAMKECRTIRREVRLSFGLPV